MSFNIGDTVKIVLDEEIKKAKLAKKRDPYVNPSVLELWIAINGKTGKIVDIDKDDIWVAGPQGFPRLFKKEVLQIV